MLDNHLSHALMKTVLPQLAVLIHDKSESVRAAFVDLLLVVKDLRAINCFDIVSVDVLLTRSDFRCCRAGGGASVCVVLVCFI